jgi:hypothetical protein
MNQPRVLVLLFLLFSVMAANAVAPPPGGARTVNRWRPQYLRDWQQRMTWLR